MIPTNGTGPGISYSRLLRLTLAYVAVLVLAALVLMAVAGAPAGATEFHCSHDAPKSECYIQGEYEVEHAHDNDPTTTTTAPAETTTQPTFHDQVSIPSTRVILPSTTTTSPAPSTALPALPAGVHVNGFADLRRVTPPPTRPGNSSPTTEQFYNPNKPLDMSNFEDREHSRFAGVRVSGYASLSYTIGQSRFGNWWKRVF